MRKRRYEDLAVSIEEHIALKAEELMAGGMPREEAERAARRKTSTDASAGPVRASVEYLTNRPTT